MKKLIILMTVMLLALFQSVCFADISPEKKELIDKLLDQTGQSAITTGKNFSNAFIQQMTMVLKQSNPEIDPKAFEIVKEEINALMDEELVQKKTLSKMMYPIYDKHFTATDLKEMIILNDTPLGKKMIKVMPLLTQEGIQAGQTLGQSLAPKIQQRIMDRFQKEGIQ